MNLQSGDKQKVAKAKSERADANLKAQMEFIKVVHEESGTALKGLSFVAAEQTDKIAEKTSDVAVITTLATGGLSSPVTVPVAEAADAVSATAKMTKASLYFSERDTEAAKNEVKDATINLALSHAGGTVVKKLTKVKAIPKSSENVVSATISIWTTIARSILFQF